MRIWVISAILTFVIGIMPALFIRFFILKKPLSKTPAFILSLLLFCVGFVLAIYTFKSVSGFVLFCVAAASYFVYKYHSENQSIQFCRVITDELEQQLKESSNIKEAITKTLTSIDGFSNEACEEIIRRCYDTSNNSYNLFKLLVSALSLNFYISKGITNPSGYPHNDLMMLTLASSAEDFIKDYWSNSALKEYFTNDNPLRKQQ